MYRRSLASALVLVAIGGFVLADTVNGIVTKTDIKDDGTGTITVTVRKKGEKKGEEKTFKVTKDTKYQKRGKGKDAEPTSAKLEDFTKAVEKASKAEKGPKGAFAKIETKDDTDTVTAITFGGGGRRPKKEDK
jgi:hypothetical protein